MHSSLRAAFVLLAVAGTGGVALAQSVDLNANVGSSGASGSADANGAPASDAPPETGDDQFTLPKGKLFIDGDIGINLSKDLAFKPVSLSPDIWYGVTDDLTLGLVHSGEGTSGLIGSSVGTSLCLTGNSKGCDDIYSNVGLDARYRLKGPIAFDGGIYVLDFDPSLFLDIKLGLLARKQWGKFSLETNPNLFIGLTKRSAGNKEHLTIPVTASYQVIPKLSLGLQPAITTPFSHAGDFWRFALALGLRYRVNDHLDLGLAFALPDLAGGDQTTGADLRTLTLGVAYAL
jgi:hypothetical protein